MLKIYPVALGLSAAGLISFSSLSIAMTPADDLFDIPLNKLSEIIITSATLHEESLRSVPASVAVFSRDQIQKMGITTLTELMNYVPGFQSQRTDNNSLSHSFSARGIRFDGSGREVLVLLDGQRLNSDWSGGVVGVYSLIDLYSAERIEFIRGPGSPIYGSNAFVGVINIFTGARNQANVSIGDAGEYQTSVQAHKVFDNKTFSIMAKKIQDDGQDVNVFDPFVASAVPSKDPYSFEDIHLKASIFNTELVVKHSRSESEQFYSVGYPSNQSAFFHEESRYVSLLHKNALPNNWGLKTTLSYASRRFDLGSVISPAPIVIAGEIEEREPKAEWVLTQNKSKNVKNVIGLEIRRPKIIDSDANLSGAIQAYLPQAPLTDRVIKGLYAQHQNSINEKLDIVLGGRLDDYSNFGSHFSLRAGLVYQYDSHHTFKALYGESFRAPSRAETDVTNSSAFVANPNLEPEVARTSELIWMLQDQSTFLTGTLFHTALSDVVVNLPVSPIERENGGGISVSGLELEWHQAWTEHWGSRTNASYSFSENDQIKSEADTVIGTGITFEDGGFNSTVLLNYHDSKQDVDSSASGVRNVPERLFIDATLNWRMTPSLELYGNIKNVLDEEYASVATARVENIEGTENRGMSSRIGLRFDF